MSGVGSARSHPNRKFRSKAQRRTAFLEMLRQTGSVSHAAAIVQVERTTPYYWRRTLPGFAEAWDLALALPAGRRRGVHDLAISRMNVRLLVLADRRNRRVAARNSASDFSTPNDSDMPEKIPTDGDFGDFAPGLDFPE